MFDSVYPVVKVTANSAFPGEDHIAQTTYRFDTSEGVRYLIYVTEYPHKFHTIDFCRNSQKRARNRFTELTSNYDSIKILSTVTRLMLQLLEKGKGDYVSFGFVGAVMPDEETKIGSKRFKLYRRIMGALISPAVYEHLQDPYSSGYVLIPNGADRENVVHTAKLVFGKDDGP